MSSLDTRTLVERIADTLRSEVVSGDLEPGLRLRQDDVARRLGVSRTPLREAFRMLETEGWFVAHPRQGVTVAGVSAEEVSATGIARLVLEPVAARIAAETHDQKAAERLSEMVAARHSIDADFSPTDFQELNRDFHLEVYGANSWWPETELTRLTVNVWEKFSRYRIYYWRDREHVRLSSKAHQNIAALWLARDGAQTECAVASHIFEAIADQLHILTPNFTPDGSLLSICERYGLSERLLHRP